MPFLWKISHFDWKLATSIKNCHFDWKLAILIKNLPFWLKIGHFDKKFAISIENWQFLMQNWLWLYEIGILNSSTIFMPIWLLCVYIRWFQNENDRFRCQNWSFLYKIGDFFSSTQKTNFTIKIKDSSKLVIFSNFRVFRKMRPYPKYFFSD